MGFLDRFIKGKAPQPVTAYMATLPSGYSPVFTSRDGGVYEAIKTHAAISQISTQFSKLKPEVICDDEGKRKRIEALFRRPNPDQTTSQYLARLCTILQCETTAFIVPSYGSDGEVAAIWSIIPSTVEAVEKMDDGTGGLWYDMRFRNGERLIVERSKIGILRIGQYRSDLYGDGNGALGNTLDLIHSQDEALENKIRQSAVIEWLVQVAQQVRPEDLKAKRDLFTADNLSKKNKTGVLIHDATYSKVEPLEYKGSVIDAAQMELINGNVCDYFGVNEAILQNSFDEDGWGSFYEGKLEPLAIQASEVFSNLLFTEKDQESGAEVMFTSNRLQYASNATKVKVTQALVDRGLLTMNQALDIWNLPHVDDGDMRVIRGEYINTDKLPEHTLEEALAAPRRDVDASDE